MIQKFNEIYTSLHAVVQGNQMLAAGLGVYGLGVFTYLVKDIPLKIIRFIKKQTTTTLTMNNCDPVFYDFLKWIDDKTIVRLVRDWNFNNGKNYSYYMRTSPSMTVGYGHTYALWKNRLFMMDRVKIEATQSSDSKEVITLTCLGRSKNAFYEMFKEIKEMNKVIDDSDLFTPLYLFRENNWVKSRLIPKRNIDTVILPSQTKSTILDHIASYKSNKEWYVSNGIPYKTGILLEGPPGTGKTSIIKALAGYLNQNIHYIDATEAGPGTIKEALRGIPLGALVVIEEIDRMSVPFKEEGAEGSHMNGAELLNAIDGMAGSDDRILIATTNNVDKLDPALLREGRFDLKIHIGYMTDETMRIYINRMYPEFKDISQYHINSNIAPCFVQKLILDNKTNVHAVLDMIAHKNGNMQVNRILEPYLEKDS
jgi:chaperone BCS1